MATATIMAGGIILPPYAGTYCLGMNGSGASQGPNEWLISPKLEFPAGERPLASNWPLKEGERMPIRASRSRFRLPTINSHRSPSTLLPDQKVTGNWVIYTYDLSAYAGDTIYLAFVSTGNAQCSYRLYLDEIEINTDIGTKAYFTVNTAWGVAPLSVQFFDRSVGSPVSSWLWNFGDSNSQ